MRLKGYGVSFIVFYFFPFFFCLILSSFTVFLFGVMEVF